MANTVTGPTTQSDGFRKLIVYCSVYSDGSASSTTLVDVSGLNTSLAYDNDFDFSTIGGLVNTEASGYSGDVLLVIPSTSDAGNEYTVWCEFLKYYEAPSN